MAGWREFDADAGPPSLLCCFCDLLVSFQVSRHVASSSQLLLSNKLKRNDTVKGAVCSTCCIKTDGATAAPDSLFMFYFSITSWDTSSTPFKNTSSSAQQRLCLTWFRCCTTPLCLSIYPFPSAILVLCPVLVPFVMHTGAKSGKACDMTLSWSVTGFVLFIIQQNGPACYFPYFVSCFHGQPTVCHWECSSNFESIMLDRMLFSMLHGMCLYAESMLFMLHCMLLFMRSYHERICLCTNDWFISGVDLEEAYDCAWLNDQLVKSPLAVHGHHQSPVPYPYRMHSMY